MCACKKYQPAPEAFYIEPGAVKLTTLSGQGSSSHKITDFWLYVDGAFKGVYPITNKIPIVNNGKQVNIVAFPGIKNNGISDTRLRWELYDKLVFDTLVEGGTTFVRPFTFRYSPNTTFKWIENFDNQGQSLIKSSNAAASTVSLQTLSNGESFENKYLELKIVSGGDYAQIETYSSFDLPLSNSNVYLELNYKCNIPVTIGLIGDNTQVKDVFTLNAQSNWNKTYIQLSNVMNNSPVSKSYEICFYMVKTEDIEPRLLLDNLKLVYL